MTASPKAPWTIPLADGPVSVLSDRLVALIVGATALTLVIALSSVSPDGRGHGTHEQFGMSRCGWPLTYGIPCPTCGCTTAATCMVHGDVVTAFVTQPFGAMIALMGMLFGIHAWMCLIRGRSFVDILVRLPFWRIVLGMFFLLLTSWGYKYLTWTG